MPVFAIHRSFPVSGLERYVAPFLGVLLFLFFGVALLKESAGLAILFIYSGTWVVWIAAFSIYVRKIERELPLQALLALPSFWLLMAPAIQCMVPMFLSFTGHWQPYDPSQETRFFLWGLVWTVLSLVACAACGAVEPRERLVFWVKGYRDGSAEGVLHRDSLLVMGLVFFFAAVLLRYLAGPIHPTELHGFARILDPHSTDVARSRFLMFVGPFLQMSVFVVSISLFASGKWRMFGAIVLFIVGASASGYEVVLGNRGNALLALSPAILTYFLLKRERARIRIMVVFAAGLLSLFFMAGDTREKIYGLGSAIKGNSVSLGDLAGYYLDEGIERVESGDDTESPILVLTRFGSFQVIPFIDEHRDNSLPRLAFWSFPRVFTAALPRSLFPFMESIPFPTEERTPDLGYIMGSYYNQEEGAGVAVPPAAEAFWRFGIDGAFLAMAIWGAVIGLAIRFWSMLFPPFSPFIPALFGIAIMVNETSWDLFADLVRLPLILVVVYVAVREILLIPGRSKQLPFSPG